LFGHAALSGRELAALISGHTLAQVRIGTAVGLGAVIGLALGIVVSITTDVPLAPEAGLVLGAFLAWLSRRDRPPA
jgi:hypothetical protein